jgi:prepilin-type N-terminal cleavage/methylation domain-containing protein
MQSFSRSYDDRGFSLLEVLMAMGIIVLVITSVSQLFAAAIASNMAARARTLSALLAAQKLEELRALTFAFGPDGTPITDSGLSPSPSDSLDHSVAGYSDYLDRFGHGSDDKNAAFVRRWSIQPLVSDLTNGIVLRVVVLGRRDAAGGAGSWARAPDVVHLVDARTRKTR